jgi:MFS family permease
LSKTPGGIFSIPRRLLLHGNIRTLALTSMITGVYVSMLNTILQPFVVKDLGFSVVILGILVAVGARPTGIASSIVQPFGGYLADLLGRRRLIIAGSAVGVCSMASFVIAAGFHNLLPLSIGYVLLGLSLLGYPASQATIAESVSMDPGKLNIAFSVVFFFTQLPGAFIPFAAGFLVTYVGYVVLFVAAALLESVNLVVLLTELKETGRSPEPGESRPRLNGQSLRKAVQIPPGFARIFAPFALDALSFGFCGSIIYGMWTAQFGFTPTDIGLIVGTLAVSILASQYAAAKLLLRVGARKTLAFSEFLTVVVLVGWLFTPSVPALVLIGVIFGVSVATWVPAQSSLIMTAAPVDERGSVSGKLAAFRGLIGFPAPILGGLLFNAFGYYLPVSVSLVGEAITTVAILKLLPQDH